MPYKTVSQIGAAQRTLWDFNFRNRRSGSMGKTMNITIAVTTAAGGSYRKISAQKKEAVAKFTKIVGKLYPNADQIVSDYGPKDKRVFV